MNLREAREAQLAGIEARLEAVTWRAMQVFLAGAATATLRDGLTAAAGDVPDPQAVTGAAAAWQELVAAQIVTEVGNVLGEVFAETLDAVGVVSARSWQENYLAEVPNRLKNIPDRVYEAVRDEVQASIDAGSSIPAMRDRVATVLSTQQGGSENSWRKRAALIARTEASGAYNGGHVAAWAFRDALTGQQTDKVWLCTLDARTRHDHYAADGQRVPLDGEFLVGGHRMAHPGDHRAPPSQTANCRCTVVDVPRGEALPQVGDRQLSGGRAAAEVRRRAEAGEFRDGDGLTATPTPASATAGAALSTEESHVSLSSTSRRGLATAAAARDGVFAEVAGTLPAEHQAKSTPGGGAPRPAGGPGADDPAADGGDTAPKTTAKGVPLETATDQELLEDAASFSGHPADEPGLQEDAAALAAELDKRGLVDVAAELRALVSGPAAPAVAPTDPAVEPAVAPDTAPPAEPTEVPTDEGSGDTDRIESLEDAYAALDPANPEDRAALEALAVQAEEAGDLDLADRIRRDLAAAADEFAARAARTLAVVAERRAARQAQAEAAQAEAAQVIEAALTAAAGDGARTWEGTLAPIGKNSGDRRRFKVGGEFTFRPLPLPLMFQERTADGHDTASVVGRILTIEERDGEFWGTGDYLEGSEFAEAVGKAIALNEAGMGHVSVDLADVVAEVVDADGSPIPQERLIELHTTGQDAALYEQFAEATIIGATQVAKPAFAEAMIALSNGPQTLDAAGAELAADSQGTQLAAGDKVEVSVDDDQGETMELIAGTVVAVDEAAGTVTVQPDQADAETLTVPAGQVTKVGGGATTELPDVVAAAERVLARAAQQLRSLQAAAGQVEEEWRPDPELFADPQLTAITPMTIGPDGRVFGHIAAWGQCHVGFSKCVTPPDEASFDYFHIGEVELSDGSALAVGNLTLGGRHADVKLAYRDAIAHYDDAGAGVAVVRAYKDEFGIAVAGVLTPETTAAQKSQLRRCGLSGDWRRIGTDMRLAGALAVNTGGFPVPRHAVDGRGRQLGLVAAGMVPPSVETPESYEDVARRVFAEETQKQARREEIRAMALTAAAGQHRDELAGMLALVASAPARRSAIADLLAEVS